MLKFLVDNALSPAVADALRQAGQDAVHVRDYRMESSPDPQVLARAASEKRVLVSADTDFSAILATSREVKPSLILFRGASQRRPEAQAEILLGNLAQILDPLGRGCIVVFKENRIRVRMLPIAAAELEE